MTPNKNRPLRAPIASVVIAAFNVEEYILDTLESVLSQDQQDVEVVVVNDGSTDRTGELVRGISDSRIRLISIPNSGGPSRPRNVGVRESEGEFIFIFDADDLMLPGKISKSIAILEGTPGAGFLFTNFHAIDERGDLLTDDFLNEYESLHRLPGQAIGAGARLIRGDDLLVGLGDGNFIGTSSMAYRRSLARELPPFDERLKNGDDYLFWIRMAARYDGVFLSAPLHQYRVHSKSISKSNPLRRLQSIVLLHETIAQDETLPSRVRKVSQSSRSEWAVSLAKECLKAGSHREARIQLWKSISIRPKGVSAFGLLALTVLPKSVLGFLLRLKRRRGFFFSWTL